MNAPNQGSPRRIIASKTTSSPTPQGSSEISRDVAERAVTAALVHWDELERSSLEALAGNDSSDRAKLDLLRSAEAWLRGSHDVDQDRSNQASFGSAGMGGRQNSLVPTGPHPTSEDLYDFGRGPGASPLQMERRTEIEAHLAECAICDRAAASLVSTPPVPIIVDWPRQDLPSQIEALPKVDRALLAQICGPKDEELPVTGAPTSSGPPLLQFKVPTKLERVRHTPAPSPHSIDDATSLPSLAGKSAPSPQVGDAIAETVSPRGSQDSRDLRATADSERETPTPRFRLLTGARPGWQKSAGVAAAALVLGMVGFNALQQEGMIADPASLGEIESIQMGFPDPVDYRGPERPALNNSLAHPRNRVLSRGSSSTLPEWAKSLQFELAEAVEGAEGYRFDLYHSPDGGAFGAGEKVATLESNEPHAALDARSAAKLKPGSYTWEAWANINGLDRSLGELDFRIVESSQTWLTLNAAEKTARTVRWLHDQGFVSDARLQARMLPSSPGRDAYLEGASAPVR